MSSGEWRLTVEGDRSDLAFLTEELKLEPTKVACDVLEAGHFVLLSDDFTGLADDKKVREAGMEHLRRLSGLLRCIEGSTTPLVPGALYWIRPDGTRDVYAQVIGAEFRIRYGHVRATLIDANGTPLPTPPSTAQLLARLMNADRSVAKVMRLTSAADSGSWVGLARIREVIESDSGGTSAIQKAGWASRAELERFRHSANSVSVAGDAARHGHERTFPPCKPMSLSEAREHVERLRREWLKSKGVST